MTPMTRHTRRTAALRNMSATWSASALRRDELAFVTLQALLLAVSGGVLVGEILVAAGTLRVRRV